MIVLFWIAAAITGYVYVGYPCLLATWARLVDRRPRRARFGEGRWPAISIILAARNEAARLPARVRNLLDRAYPGRCEILLDRPKQGFGVPLGVWFRGGLTDLFSDVLESPRARQRG
jgi:hypothetical protein